MCSNNVSPNVSEYSQTIPYYICTEWGNNCVKNCGNVNTCQDACRYVISRSSTSSLLIFDSERTTPVELRPHSHQIPLFSPFSRPRQLLPQVPPLRLLLPPLAGAVLPQQTPPTSQVPLLPWPTWVKATAWLSSFPASSLALLSSCKIDDMHCLLVPSRIRARPPVASLVFLFSHA